MPSALLRCRIRKARRRPFRRRRKRQREEQRHWDTPVASLKVPPAGVHAEQGQRSARDAGSQHAGTLVCARPTPARVAGPKPSSGWDAPSGCSPCASAKDGDGSPRRATTGPLGRRWTSTTCWKGGGRERVAASTSGRRSVSFNSPFEWIRMDPAMVAGELVAENWSRRSKERCDARSEAEDVLRTNGLERDDPEGRRVLAAMLRTRSSKMLTEPASGQHSEKVLEWETATPGSTEVLPSRATWSGGQRTTEDLDDGEPKRREKKTGVEDLEEGHAETVELEPTKEDVDAKLGVFPATPTESDRNSDVRASDGHVRKNDVDGKDDDSCHAKRDCGVGERFWTELEGLREENRLLRHENEVCRIQGSIHAMKSRVCEVLSYVLYSTAFGFQSEQVDSSIQALVDDTGSWIASVVENILDKCVVLLRYIPGDSADDGTLAAAEEACDADAGNEGLAGKSGVQGISLVMDDNAISSEAVVLVAVSRALGHMTAINQRWSGVDESVSTLRWDGLFDIRGQRDIAELKRMQRWLHDVFSAVRSASYVSPAAFGQPYACDHLARLRLKSHLEEGTTDAGADASFSLSSSCSFVYGGRGSAEDKILFVPFCLANRFYALGVHSARTDQGPESLIGRAASLPASRVRASSERVVSQKLSYEAEIILRKDSYKIVLRLVQGVLKLLSAAQMMLGRSNTILNTCTALITPNPTVFSDAG